MVPLDTCHIVMAGQVLPSAEGNIRQKMADLHLDLASQEVIVYHVQITGELIEKTMLQGVK